MFDMGFTELMIIGIVALIVIGPERLPGVARTAGKYVGKLRRFMTNVKADVESELRADELREMLSKQQDEIQSLKEVVNEVGREVDTGVSDMEAEIDRAAAEYQKQAAETGVDWTESIKAPEAGSEKIETKAETPANNKPKPKAAKKTAAKAKPKATKKKAAKKKAVSKKSVAGSSAKSATKATDE